MPIDYSRYPPNWATEIRPRILRRAGEIRDASGHVTQEARCEWCGVENRSVGVRDRTGRWHTAEQIGEGSLYSDDTDYRPIRIVLTVAHLDHDPENAAVKDDRLAALCQACHLRYDHAHHMRHARDTRDRRGGQLQLSL